MISGFCREVDEILAVMRNYAVYSGNSLLMFWDNLSVQSSGFEKMGLSGHPETPIKNYH
jgi:hypothetical protein